MPLCKSKPEHSSRRYIEKLVRLGQSQSQSQSGSSSHKLKLSLCMTSVAYRMRLHRVFRYKLGTGLRYQNACGI